MNNKIAQVKCAIRQLNSILLSDKIYKKNKKAIYHAIVESITTYGAEIWELNKKEKNKLLFLEMDFWRRSSRHSKLDHVQNDRMANNRWPKKVWVWTPRGRRKRGRPPGSWKKDVEEEVLLRGLQEPRKYIYIYIYIGTTCCFMVSLSKRPKVYGAVEALGEDKCLCMSVLNRCKL
nr:unnamed protein product [Callosobruchus analis]